MRVIPILALSSLLLLAVPASACTGAGSDDEEFRYCNDYTIHVGDESNGIHANENGQFLLAANPSDTGFYVEQDVDYLHRDPNVFFSIWIYSESNGRPGLQRADEVCNSTPAGEPSDAAIC